MHDHCTYMFSNMKTGYKKQDKLVYKINGDNYFTYFTYTFRRSGIIDSRCTTQKTNILIGNVTINW
jgi:hypothetical protein